MAKNKPPEFTSYKFKNLKVYASTEWLADSRKKYRQVFSKNETTYIYTEFSFYNKLFDEEDWEVVIMLKAFHVGEEGLNPEPLCEIEVQKKISQTLNTVYIREGWGNEKPGGFWKEGEFVWKAYLDEEEVGNCRFFVQDIDPVTPAENPYFTTQSVRLFESDAGGRRQKERTYYTDFYNQDTRYIYTELTGTNRLERDWWCEMVFKFYNDARQLKGRTIELVKIKAGESSFAVTSGWGSDYKGTWFQDNYTVEIVFMDTLIGLAPFRVGDQFIEGEVPLLKIGEGNPALLGTPAGLENLDDSSLEDVLKEFENLIGLEKVKTRVREYAQYLNFLKLRKEKGFDDAQKISLHAVFTGNPGTGKTTVANMLGKIYKKLGLLSRGHVHEVDRADVIGEYIGQTAPKIKEALKKARGGILFIDEAYSLAREGDDKKDFGREVVEILVKEMSDGKGDLAVIVAGYPKEMENFLSSNPGLKSRFNITFDFADYLPDELHKIAHFASEKRSVSLGPKASEYLKKKLTLAYRGRGRSFGNARYVFSLIDEAKMNLGLRIMRSDKLEEVTNEELSTILKEDIQEIFEKEARKKARLPIDESLLKEALDELNQMIGLDEIKTEVHELVKLVKFYRETGKDVLNRFSLHTVFTGNPGTGKTTMARLLGKIYKALAILERGEVIEGDRQMLVAGFVGQTALKTNELIDKARGSVLFIDEAYALAHNGPKGFGQEAIDTLLKRMEDMRGELVVIVAGYPDLMNGFLDSNPGLKSRFDRKLQFKDYSPEDLFRIAVHMFHLEQLTLDKAASKHLERYLHHLYETRTKFFGNARSVRKVVEKAIKNQHLRLASIAASKRSKKAIATVILADVDEFERDSDKLLESGQQGRIGF